MKTLTTIFKEIVQFLVDYGNMYSNRMYIGKLTEETETVPGFAIPLGA